MKRSSLVLALGSFLLSAGAWADLLTYDFTAVNFGRNDLSADPSLHLPGGFATGAIASGFITFETSFVDSVPDNTQGTYVGAVVDFQVTIDGWLFDYDATLPGASSSASVLDRESPLSDRVTFSARDGFSVFSMPQGSPYSFALGLQTASTTPLQLSTGDALISDLTAIPSWWLTWVVVDRDQSNVTSTSVAAVTSLVQRPTSVPEPGAAVLLLTGLLGLAVRRKRAPVAS